MSPMTMDPSASLSAGVFHADLALTALRPSKTNPRKHFDDEKLRELARSLIEHGVIEPLIVRPHKNASDTFEIVAGERRFLAAKLAGLTEVPVIERTLTDEQVIEIQLIENIQRDDLSALEQARGYKALIDANPGKHTAASIAVRVGMSEAWVWDRLKLNDLIPEAKALLEQDRMSTGHAILIARQKPADQKRIIDPDDLALFAPDHGFDFDEARHVNKTDPYADLKARSVRELEKWIAEHIRFDLQHAAKAVPLEFAETAQTVAAAAAQPGRGKKVIPITFDHYLQPDARSDEERTYGPRSFKLADGSKKSNYDMATGRYSDAHTCDQSIIGVVVAGERQGQTIAVCIAREKCEIHWGKELKAKQKNDTLRSSGQGKKADRNEEARIAREAKAEAEQRAKDARWKVFHPALKKATLEAAQKLKTLQKHQLQAVLKANHLPTTLTVAELPKALLLQALEEGFRYAWHSDEARLVGYAKLLGVDVKACEPKPAKKETAA